MRAASAARTILDGFDRHQRLFRAASARAKEHRERADWAPSARPAARASTRTIGASSRGADAVHAALGGRVLEEALWPAIRRAYTGMLHEHFQPECGESIFNSLARRVLDRRDYTNDHIFRRPEGLDEGPQRR